MDIFCDDEEESEDDVEIISDDEFNDKNNILSSRIFDNEIRILKQGDHWAVEVGKFVDIRTAAGCNVRQHPIEEGTTDSRGSKIFHRLHLRKSSERFGDFSLPPSVRRAIPRSEVKIPVPIFVKPRGPPSGCPGKRGVNWLLVESNVLFNCLNHSAVGGSTGNDDAAMLLIGSPDGRVYTIPLEAPRVREGPGPSSAREGGPSSGGCEMICDLGQRLQNMLVGNLTAASGDGTRPKDRDRANVIIVVGVHGKVLVIARDVRNGRALRLQEYDLPGPVVASVVVRNWLVYSTGYNLKKAHLVEEDKRMTTAPLSPDLDLPRILSTTDLNIRNVIEISPDNTPPLINGAEELTRGASCLCKNLKGRTIKIELESERHLQSTAIHNDAAGQKIKDLIECIEVLSNKHETLKEEQKQLDEIIRELSAAKYISALSETILSASFVPAVSWSVDPKISVLPTGEIIRQISLTFTNRHGFNFSEYWTGLVTCHGRPDWPAAVRSDEYLNSYTLTLSDWSGNGRQEKNREMLINLNEKFRLPIKLSFSLVFDVVSLLGGPFRKRPEIRTQEPSFCFPVSKKTVDLLNFLVPSSLEFASKSSKIAHTSARSPAAKTFPWLDLVISSRIRKEISAASWEEGVAPGQAHVDEISNNKFQINIRESLLKSALQQSTTTSSSIALLQWVLSDCPLINHQLHNLKQPHYSCHTHTGAKVLFTIQEMNKATSSSKSPIHILAVQTTDFPSLTQIHRSITIKIQGIYSNCGISKSTKKITGKETKMKQNVSEISRTHRNGNQRLHFY